MVVAAYHKHNVITHHLLSSASSKLSEPMAILAQLSDIQVNPTVHPDSSQFVDDLIRQHKEIMGYLKESTDQFGSSTAVQTSTLQRTTSRSEDESEREGTR